MPGVDAWRHRWPDVLIFLAAFFLQVSVLPLWGGVRPDLLLAVAIVIGMKQGAQAGGLTGLLGGMLLDLVRGQFVGSFALTHALTGYMAGMIQAKLFENALYLPFLFAMAGTVFSELSFWALMAIWGMALPLSLSMLGLIGKEAFWNALVSPIVYRLAAARVTAEPARARGRAA